MQIPKSMIDLTSEILGGHYSHNGLNSLFLECGAPGETPLGNKVDKCSTWLKLTNAESRVDPLRVLGKLLEYYMDYEIPDSNFNIVQWVENRERIHRALARHGLVYEFGGMVLATHGSSPRRALNHILRARDLPGVEEEFRRIEGAIDPDPRGALTAACALLESLFKIYIEDEALEMPRDQTIKPLWSVVSKELGLDPASLPDDDLKRILSGLTSVVDGLGALRTHAGSAHGRGRIKYRPEPRHARVVANSACTLATFVLETWEKRKRQETSNA
jgi:Abortive infection C-terminus